ncbi:hypothetical protein Poli38472_009208 [Pythium oligandrum]|uniref:Ankyrin repeat protein n=1 Tax=Pythium oligandrum TaxID=41045 RepID=A0A8K1FJK9_PYTOL|nr:hypothetical protein Poli38472_009208 [Pythium oligandrum]|eukprot:TMW65041.1 hypothetical protein Poli38472_009208 [Pythium oligandrum]
MMMREKAQVFAHRVVEFADTEACCKFFQEKQIDFDQQNDVGWTVLMSVCACERVDLVGLVVDATKNLEAATTPNGTTVLHLAAMASNPRVIQQLASTPERIERLKSIANISNRNGDTPLMMASVAKNAAAAQVLLEQLDSDPNHANASGMTALMCASRLPDEREAAPQTEASDAIVELLLRHGADVNAADAVGLQTPLHLAVLSRNEPVILRLLAESKIDLTLRNKAKSSALDLAKRMQLASSTLDAFKARWEAIESEARALSEALADTLVKVSLETEPKRSSSKKKSKKAVPITTTTSNPLSSKQESAVEVSPEPTAERGGESSDSEADSTDYPRIVELDEDEASSEWLDVATRRSRRKQSIATDDTPKPKKSAKKPQLQTKKKQPKQQPTPEKAESVPAVPIKAKAIPTPVQPPPSLATDVSQADSRADFVPPSPRLEAPSYEALNAIFHRMFPITDEMDISVESFIPGASTGDSSALLQGLSISQVEILQEAHLQAYHYLNERKIELARELEAERLEAQLELRRQILELP